LETVSLLVGKGQQKGKGLWLGLSKRGKEREKIPSYKPVSSQHSKKPGKSGLRGEKNRGLICALGKGGGNKKMRRHPTVGNNAKEEKRLTRQEKNEIGGTMSQKGETVWESYQSSRMQEGKGETTQVGNTVKMADDRFGN